VVLLFLRNQIKRLGERTEDGQSVDAVVKQLFAKTASWKMRKYYSLRLQVLGGYNWWIWIKIEDKGNDDWQTVSKVSNEFLGELMKRPEIQYAITNFNPSLNIKWILMSSELRMGCGNRNDIQHYAGVLWWFVYHRL
jgi:hypothetical protein